MNKTLKTIAQIAALFSFLSCLISGLWILTAVGFDRNEDNIVWTGLGLYFVGKAFFVGPMLLVAAQQLGRGGEGK